MGAMNPTPDEVSRYYDYITRFFEIVGGESLHVGYWPSDTAGSSLADAQERFTDFMIAHAGARAGQQFLDIGCGTGYPAIRLAQATGCSTTGITISHTQVQRSNERALQEGMNKQVSFQHANAMALPFPDESFDNAWAFESIFHMPDRTQVLREAARVLRPGGRILVADAVRVSPMTAEEEAIYHGALMAKSFIARDDYPPIVRDAGLELEEVFDIGANTMRSMPLVAEAIVQKKDDIRRDYGAEFLAAIEAQWPRVVAIHQRCMGYVVVAARKPSSPR